MDQHFLTLVAVHVLEAWFLALGFQPTGCFESDDPACMRDYGPYRVWTIQARVPDGTDIDRHDLLKSLTDYLDKQADLPGAIRFHAYSIDLYNSFVCGDYVLASIYHTA